jgi:hypothetical protein
MVEISDSTGGTLTMTSGMTISFPPGAFKDSGCPDPCPVIAKSVPASQEAAIMSMLGQDKPGWQNLTQATSFYDLEPAIKFAQPVTVCMKALSGAASNASEVYQVNLLLDASHSVRSPCVVRLMNRESSKI